MLREIARPAAIGLGRLAGDAEIADERLSLSHLLVFQLEDFADSLQREGQPHVRAPYQGAAPGGRVKVVPDGISLYAVGGEVLRIVPAQPDRKADPLEGRIVGPLDYGIIRDGFDNLLRYDVAGRQIISLQLSQRIQHTSSKFIRGRLMSYFSECAKRAGSNSFLIPYNRQQLADYLNVDRSTMCNELSKMQKDGIIEYERNRILLKA